MTDRYNPSDTIVLTVESMPSNRKKESWLNYPVPLLIEDSKEDNQ